ncbi:MAG: hypothetical protein KAT32_02340 [Candidatus Moranbacteria bacterium]|nr:hypothetical protein [Candidatus Moranbacteria bacterium]
MINLDDNFSKLINNKKFKLFLLFILGYLLITLLHSIFVFNFYFPNSGLHFFLKDLFFKSLFIAFFSSCMISFFPLTYLIAVNLKKIKEKYFDFLLTFSIILFGFASLIFAIKLAEEYFLPYFESF